MSTSCIVDDALGIAEGDAVCLVGWDGGTSKPKVARASRSKLATSKTVYGVAVSPAGDTDPIEVLVAGEVVPTTLSTGLPAGAGAGTSRIVATDVAAEDDDPAVAAGLQCRLVRVERPNGSEYVVGTCDENGNVSVQPRASRDTSTAHVFNVCAYGAVGDGDLDAGTGTDNSAAFAAALAAMGPAGTREANQTLYVPPGIYRLEDNLDLTRAIVLRGAGGGGGGLASSTLFFAPYKGLRVFGTQNAPDGGDAALVLVKDLDLAGSHVGGEPGSERAIEHPVWEANETYVVGQKVLPAAERSVTPGHSFEYTYECIQGGDSAAVEPDWPTFQEPDWSELRTNATVYAKHAVVRVAGRWDAVFRVDELQGGAMSAAMQDGAFATQPPTDTSVPNAPKSLIVDNEVTWEVRPAYCFVEDGDVVWSCRVFPGVHAQERVVLERTNVQHFLNAAIHVQASGEYSPPSNANTFCVRDVQAYYCGGGIVTRGSEAQAGLVERLVVRGWGDLNDQVGNPLLSDKDFGVAERSFLGNVYVACLVETTCGPAYQASLDANTGAFVGCYCEGSCGLNRIRSNGFQVLGGIWGTGFTTDSYFAGFATYDDWRNVSAKATTVGDKRLQSYFATDESSLFGFQADDSAYYVRLAYDRVLDGCWTWEWAKVPETAAFGIDGGRGPLGGGSFVFPRGYFEGTAAPRLRAADATAAEDFHFRGGKREVGDRVSSGAGAVPGAFLERVVSTEGWSAPPWIASSSPRMGNSGKGRYFASVVRAGNGYVYRCVRSVPPAPNLPAETGAAPPTWTTDVVTEETRFWTAGLTVVVGDYVRPSAANGHRYLVTAVLGSGVMTTEPMWPTGAANVVVVPDELEYTEAGADTTFVTDNDVSWECVGLEAQWSDASYVVPRAALVTTDDVPTELARFATLPAPSVTRVVVDVRAVEDAAADGADLRVRASVLRDALGATVLGAAIVDDARSGGAAAWDAALVLDGTDVVLEVTGEAATTIRWEAAREMA